MKTRRKDLGVLRVPVSQSWIEGGTSGAAPRLLQRAPALGSDQDEGCARIPRPASRAPRPTPGGHSPRAAATCALQTRGPPSPRVAERASGPAHRCGLEELRLVELHKPCAGWLSRATHPPANTRFKVTGEAPTSLHLQVPREGWREGR